ncbi:hypothetical protein ACIBH1_09395 [Nonomuraea sp. NPDC050663]|uniref:hypothetical protein n=1 Tax=Nonomuraea sp. NPDC050663 TaxID=3364370 RepID=UPI00379C50B5
MEIHELVCRVTAARPARRPTVSLDRAQPRAAGGGDPRLPYGMREGTAGLGGHA